jgi:hypothetical protein
MKHIIQALLVVIVITGCYKDKGNYAYQPINDIVATTTADTFRVNQFDTLVIHPSITGTDTNRLSYEWRVYPLPDPTNPNSIGMIGVISRERFLHIPITVKPNTFYYNLDFVVKDTVTGVSYFKKMYMQVTTNFQTGWMALEQKSGGADISFIRADYTAYHGVYSGANPSLPLPATARQLVSINTGSLLNTLNMVYYDGGGYTMDNTSLQVTADYTKLFYTPPAVVQPYTMAKPTIYAYGPYTLCGGKVYALNGLFASKLFGTSFTAPDNLGYTVAPFIAGGLSYGGVFFDQLNYRFLYDGGSTSTTLKTFPANNTMAFDLNNVPKKMLTMKAGLGNILAPSNWYIVFKNLSNDNCFLYTLNPGGNLTTSPVAEAQQAILNSPGVESSPDYLFSSTIKQLYYAAGNKLYLYDMVANQSRVIYEFTAGESITAMAMQSGVITLATYNGHAGGGSIYYLPVAATGDISGNTYSKLITGFEKIVSLVYKVG